MQRKSGKKSIVVACVYDDVRLGPSARQMLGVLGTYADYETGYCRPDLKTLAGRLGITRQAVSRAIHQLERAGYLEILERHASNGARLANHYRLVQDYELPDEYRRVPHDEVEGPSDSDEGVLAVVDGGLQPERQPPPSTVEGAIEQPTPDTPSGTTQPERTDLEAQAPPGEPAGSSGSKKKDDEASRAQVAELFEYYQLKIQPTALLCPTDKITTRLKRFSLEQLKAGVDNFAADAWWMEHNARRGAAWFFHSDTRSEQFLTLVPRGKTGSGSQRPESERPTVASRIRSQRL